MKKFFIFCSCVWLCFASVCSANNTTFNNSTFNITEKSNITKKTNLKKCVFIIRSIIEAVAVITRILDFYAAHQQRKLQQLEIVNGTVSEISQN